MATDHDDLFVIYLRAPRDESNPPEVAERPLFMCYTYGEARKLQRLFRKSPHQCVIRFLGETGGGD
jgi:hypothetical protein